MSTHKPRFPVDEAANLLGSFVRMALAANYGDDAPVYALILVDTEAAPDATESVSCIVSNAGEVEQVRAMLVSTLYATYKDLETRDLPGEQDKDERFGDAANEGPLQ